MISANSSFVSGITTGIGFGASALDHSPMGLLTTITSISAVAVFLFFVWRSQ